MSELFSGPPDEVEATEVQLRAIGETPLVLHGRPARHIIMRSAGYDVPPIPLVDEYFSRCDFDIWRASYFPDPGDDVGEACRQPHRLDPGLMRGLHLGFISGHVCVSTDLFDAEKPVDPDLVRPVVRVVEGRTGPIEVATFSVLTQLVLNGGLINGARPKDEEPFRLYRDFVRRQLENGQLTGDDAPLPLESYNAVADFNRRSLVASGRPHSSSTKFLWPIDDVADLLNI